MSTIADRLRQIADELDDKTWADDIYEVLRPGPLPNEQIYRDVKRLRRLHGRTWPAHADRAICACLQAHCRHSPQYRGDTDLFRPVRRGVWRLRVPGDR